MSNGAKSVIDEFRDRHTGQDFVVCGLGPSIVSLAPYLAGHLTVGVNDIGKHFTPNYLVIQDYPSAFLRERRKTIERTAADCAFLAFDFPNLQAKHILHVKLKNKGGSDFGKDGWFSYSTTSVYLATCIAAFLGARRIALAGVDFDGLGRAYRESYVECMNRSFLKLRVSFAQQGISLFTMNKSRKFNTLPYVDPIDFLDGDQ